ncbi:PilT/PilU family type 4a pilus ATPase [candidate division KSB3 bacterium]|uniref:PilT/PilU family type 4a pilus ATPase n=1 Tax=candidate division KSB3 bacterium TaxID=2044937 RepID=A0A9D5JRU5_9BACT|nr:PilT/PilU family type 4a pilus ATPase [candidate division KSB3 bacterium]MBD3323003.1 PilT/PilU family type 4a pilus ATPase [candidate division KSB3 bacterium]
MDVMQLLEFGVKQGASDVHLSAGEPPMLRVHGVMKKLNVPALTQEVAHEMIFDIMNDNQQRLFQENLECDFSIELPGGTSRFRVNAFMQRRGESAVFRQIPTKILTFEDLGLPSVLKQVSKASKGLVLVTGPTGSGKSTTLAAMIDLINKEDFGHVLTIEDPIEFVHKSQNSLVNQREVGPHTLSFANALRSALREDPDVILVGEMRDLETISLALTAAETGHLVFGTLHTSSAPKTIDRIIDVFPASEQGQVRAGLSESLRAVISQTLLKKADGKGRVAALEIMIGIPAIRNLIREAKIHQIPSIMQTGQQYGMQTLDQMLVELVTKRLVTKEEAMTKTTNPDLFKNMQKYARRPTAGSRAKMGAKQ